MEGICQMIILRGDMSESGAVTKYTPWAGSLMGIFVNPALHRRPSGWYMKMSLSPPTALSVATVMV